MSLSRNPLLIATGNPGKFYELTEMLADLPLRLTSLGEFPGIREVDEWGTSFDENARLKAAGYAVQTGSYSLADDSGLEVAALDDRPGVLTARYGGPGTSFAEKMNILLAELDATGGENRSARFVCSIAVSDPVGTIIATSSGVCNGKIASQMRGDGGFGFDPVFVPDGFDLTFGELSDEQKGKISHRFRAFEQIKPFLRDFIDI